MANAQYRYDWTKEAKAVKNGEKLWEDDPLYTYVSKKKKEYAKSHEYITSIGEPDVPLNVQWQKKVSQAYTSPEKFVSEATRGEYNPAKAFGEALQNKEYSDITKKMYKDDITERYAKVSNYTPKIKIIKQETEKGKLTSMDKFSNQTLGVFGNIKNLKKPKTVYQYKGENIKDPVTGDDVETIQENIMQINVIAEDKDFYYYRIKPNAAGGGAIQSVKKEFVREELPDLEQQKLSYMASQVKNSKNVADMSDKIFFNVGEGMRRMALGSETKAQLDTGNNIINKVTDIGGEILGFGVPTGAASSLMGGLQQTGEKFIGGLAKKAPTAISKQLTSGVGKAVTTGATEMAAYTGLENLENKKTDEKVKLVLENMLIGGVFGGTVYGVAKGAKKLIQVWKGIPDTPETLNLVEAAKNEYLNAYDDSLLKGTKSEQDQLANEAAEKFYVNIKSIEGKYKIKNTQAEKATADWEAAVEKVQNRFQQKELTVAEQEKVASELGINTDELIAAMEKADKEGTSLLSNITNPKTRRSYGIYQTGEAEKLAKIKNAEAKIGGKPLKKNEVVPSKEVGISENVPSKIEEVVPSKVENETELLGKKTELETKLKSLLDSEKTEVSKDLKFNLAEEIKTTKQAIKDIDLQMFGGEVKPIRDAQGVNQNIEKTKSHIVSKSKTQKKTLGEKWDTFYRQVIDRNRSLQTVTEKAGKGKALAVESPYKLSNIASSYEGRAKSNIEQYISDRTGKKIGEGLADIMKRVPKNKSAEVKDYLALRQAAHLLETAPEKATVYPKEWGLTVADMKAKLKNYEDTIPGIKNLANRTTFYNKRLAKTELVDSGLLSSEEFRAMEKANPYYTPNKRVMKDVEVGKASGGNKASYTGQSNQVKTREGSERQIVDQYESMIENTFNYAKAAKRNEVGQTLYKMVEKDPKKLKGIVEIVEKSEIPKGDTIQQRINEGDLEGFVNDINSGFEIKKVKDLSKPNVVRVRIKGENKYMQVNNAELLDNLAYLNTDQINTFVEGVRKITGNMKALTTGINPMFGLARNSWRDVVTAYVQSKTLTKIPVVNYVEHVKDLVGSLIGSTLKTKNYKEYRAMGGGFFSSAVGTERNLLKETVGKYADKSIKSKAKSVVKSPINLLTWLNNSIETMPRYAEYTRTLKKLSKQGIDEYSAKMEALYNGQEVTVNFQRSGEFTKGADAFVPYLNAAVQGIDKTLRTLNPKNPGELANVLSKGVTGITIPALYLYSLNHNNPDYNQLSDYIKDNNFLIPYGKKGQFIKIPKPREFGVLFGSLPERMAKEYADKDPEAFKNFMETVYTNFTPPNILLDSIAAPLIRNIRNKAGSTWRGTPVVPQNLLNLSPKNQYDENTSAIAKFIGEKLNFAPKKVDEIMSSYLGGAQQLIKPATSSRALNEKGVIKSAIEVLKKQITADSKYNTDITNDFYTKMENVTMKKSDMKAAGKLKGDETYVENASYVFSKVSQSVSDLRAKQKAAKTNEEKDKIQEKMNKLMSKTLDDYKNNYLKKNKMESIQRENQFTRRAD